MALLAVASVLFGLGLARHSTESLHVLHVGPYSPFRVAYLSILVALIVGSATWLRRNALPPGPATFVVGIAMTVASAGVLAGYLDAIVLSDSTLAHLPPSDQKEDVPLAAISFVRVTMIFLVPLFAGVVVAVRSLRGGGQDLAEVGARWCVLLTLAVRDALGFAARLAGRMPAVTFGALAVLMLTVHVTGFRFVAGDAAAFWIVGRVIVDGGLPYRDLWDVKFPGIHYISAVFEALERKAAALGLPFGLAAGLGETVLMALTVLVFYRVSREFLDRRAALGLAALFALVANDPILTPGGHLTENYVLLPALMAILCALRVLRGSPAATALLGVGAFSAIAAMVRPPGLAPFLVFVAVIWLPVLRRAGPASPRRAVRASMIAAAGFLLPWLALLGYFAQQGILADFIEIPVGFNRFAAGNFPLSSRLAQTALAASYAGLLLPVIVVTTFITVRTAWRSRHRGADSDMRLLFVLLLAVVEYAGVVGPGLVKFNYMLEAAPAFCLIVGIGLSRLRATGLTPPPVAVAVVGAVLLFQVAACYVVYLVRPEHMVVDNESVIPAATFIKAHTRPGERVLVVTRQPEVIHYHADRLPVSRFLYLQDNMVAYTKGRALEEIRDGLARVRPGLVLVDVTRRGFRPAPTFLERTVLPYIDAHYEPVGSLETPRITYRIYRPRSAPKS